MGWDGMGCEVELDDGTSSRWVPVVRYFHLWHVTKRQATNLEAWKHPLRVLTQPWKYPANPSDPVESASPFKPFSEPLSPIVPGPKKVMADFGSL